MRRPRRLVFRNAGQMSQHKPWCPCMGLEGIIAGVQSRTITPYQAAVEFRRRCDHILLMSCHLDADLIAAASALAANCDLIIADEEDPDGGGGGVH